MANQRPHRFWSVYPATQLSGSHREIWRNLNDRCNRAHPLLATEFVVPLMECMGNDDLVLAVRKDRDRVSGLVLLERSAPGVWQTFMPSQGCLCPFLLDAQASAHNGGNVASELLEVLPGRPWLLSFLMLDPHYSVMPVAPDHKLVERVKYGTTTRVEVRNFDSFWASRSRNLRRGILQRLKRLDRDGIRYEMRMIGDPKAMDSAIAAHGILESKGWKEKAGTSIHPDNVQGRLYAQIMLGFARRRQARVYQLLFGRAIVASLMTVHCNRILVVLKTTYDESRSKYAPGRLLDYLMMQRIFNDREFGLIENYTSASSADMEWSTGTRDLFHLNYFRSTLVRGTAMAARKLRHLVKRRGPSKTAGP